jgi:hypothetical protein
LDKGLRVPRAVIFAAGVAQDSHTPQIAALAPYENSHAYPQALGTLQHQEDGPYSPGVLLWGRYGILRGRLYQLLNSAVIGAKGKLREAEREAAFRREVLRLVR